jgi:hypothetical protein
MHFRSHLGCMATWETLELSLWLWDILYTLYTKEIAFRLDLCAEQFNWSLYSLIWDFLVFWDNYKYKNMDKITRILENVVRCKYFKAGVHIKNPIKNSYQDGLGRTTQTLDSVVVVQILIWDKRKSQINEYSDTGSS